jgi:homoserine kinase
MIKGYDDAVKAGLGTGAYGVTISGAGSTLVAVCGRDATGDVGDAMAEALTARGNTAKALCPHVVEGGLEVVRSQTPAL